MQAKENEKVTLADLQKQIETMRAEYEAKLASLCDEKNVHRTIRDLKIIVPT